jgi:hypothetical protein
MSSSITPFKEDLCYHLGNMLARIERARRGSLRLKLLKAYARLLVKIINLGGE